ncbi:50S ribosomal protein L2 [Candidatus Gottesmanbacteria bacterium RIFOXYB1_FULL_47_11]|uniref:Large ribosomal subunit protein uL2 n=1 Tax=Candidatus Gottesmanbacteria bacterium RIFOXYB1_FULL_47_11 TaxID=1798401 RepID=A0A1F6BE65_9BACT|nr:MAG: 50S ribosomal protein L2 [Candidatus Gottesmanbacteria bacterium RIFOXYB1_FULL_47_11]
MEFTTPKSLTVILPKRSGRDVAGHVSMRHQGGRHKRFYRVVDWKRDKISVPARVASIEYDPNRTCDIALLVYTDGEKRYILAPVGLTVGQTVVTSDTADVKQGNSLTLGAIPVGTLVHSVEIKPGHGAQMIRSAGGSAMVLARDGDRVQLKLPSGEIRVFDGKCRATVGQLGNVEHRNEVIGKAGRSRHMGIRPTVRGVAQNPRSHPHGGGEGRSGIGMSSPKSPWGKHTLGKKTRSKKKYSNKFILQRRK